MQSKKKNAKTKHRPKKLLPSKLKGRQIRKQKPTGNGKGFFLTSWIMKDLKHFFINPRKKTQLTSMLVCKHYKRVGNISSSIEAYYFCFHVASCSLRNKKNKSHLY